MNLCAVNCNAPRRNIITVFWGCRGGPNGEFLGFFNYFFMLGWEFAFHKF